MKKAPTPRQVGVLKKRFPEATLAQIQEAFGEKKAPQEEPSFLKETPRRKFLPSASKTDLLLACQWPFNRMLPVEEVGVEARFGSAFHARAAPLLVREKPLGYQALAKKWGVEAKTLKSRVETSLPVLIEWLEGGNPWGHNFREWATEVESAFAVTPATGTARRCEPPTEEEHVYPDRQRWEVPGAVDLLAISSPATQALIVDHKSGYETPPVGASGQLKTLALAVQRLFGVSKVIVAFFHAPAFGSPTVLSDTLSPRDLEDHRRDLQRALSRIGDGSLTPGEHCRYCPAFMVCPTNTTSLVQLKRNPGELTKEKVGHIHQALQEYDRLAGLLRGQLRAYVEANGPAGPRPSDGKWIDLVKRPWTNLSQASIRRALPPRQAEKLIEQLEKLGCIEHTERLELRAVDD